jgi:hypothetical protein
MLEFFTQYPWLIALGLVMLIPLTAILIAVPFENWRKVREAETEASLKHAMLERGMSADEIATVMNSGSKSAKRKFCGTSTFIRNMAAPSHEREPSRVL